MTSSLSSVDDKVASTQHRSKSGDRVSHFEQQKTLILSVLEENKAENVLSLNLKGKSSVTDLMILASGRSHIHVGAIADYLLRRLKEEGYGRFHAEGRQSCDWVLIDTPGIMVHIFRPEVRDFYDLEKMWSVDFPDETPVTDAIS